MNTYLVREQHIPPRPRFPAIDAHNHLWADWKSVDRVAALLAQSGVVAYADLTANIAMKWVDGGYALLPGSYDDFRENAVRRYPELFYGFTTANFTAPAGRPLFSDIGEFAEKAVEILRRDVNKGARGLKILKEFGLQYRDGRGQLVRIDDPGLRPVWREAARLEVPVLTHQSDPYGFFQPVTPENEHFDSLRKYPSWSFCDDRFPSKRELIERRDRLVRENPGTTFMLPHVANYAEDLAYVGRLLDECPNVYIDFSARCDELGRQPYSAREFMIRYQDRIYFGTDMPVSTDMYRFHFRFLETRDEYFVPPDYDGTFDRHRWRVFGLGLPDAALQKIYYLNALRIVPGLREQTGLGE